jgi:hypothetical protein
MSQRTSSPSVTDAALDAIRIIFANLDCPSPKATENSCTRTTILMVYDNLVDSSHLDDLDTEDDKLRSISESMVIYAINFFVPMSFHESLLVDESTLKDRSMATMAYDRCYEECKIILLANNLKSAMKRSQQARGITGLPTSTISPRGDAALSTINSFHSFHSRSLADLNRLPTSTISPQRSPRGGAALSTINSFNSFHSRSLADLNLHKK